MKILIDREKEQYRANLHCHSTISDGALTPAELKAAYRREGYSVLAITDHEAPFCHTELSEPDFLMLTGYECYIRQAPGAKYDIYAPETHLNLFARDPGNEKLICWNDRYVKYLPKHRDRSEIVRAGSEEPREYSPGYINRYIAEAKANGYLVAYNHPVWSLETEEDIMAYDGCFSFEIFNSSSELLNGIEYNGGLYDRMLRRGKRIFCHAADDNHNKYPFSSPLCDSFRSYTMISAPSLSYPDIIAALEKGDFYASRGPRIHFMTFDGDTLHIECSGVKRIFAYLGSKTPARAYAEEGKLLTEADLTINRDALYFRVSVFDEFGNTADTRAFFPEEFKREQTNE